MKMLQNPQANRSSLPGTDPAAQRESGWRRPAVLGLAAAIAVLAVPATAQAARYTIEPLLSAGGTGATTWPAAINKDGTAVINAPDGPYVCLAGQACTPMPAVPGATGRAEVVDIADSGLILGSYVDATTGAWLAFVTDTVYSGWRAVQPPTPDVCPYCDGSLYPAGIDNRGRVAFTAFAYDETWGWDWREMYVQTPDGRSRQIATLGGYDVYAYGVSDRGGYVVGTSYLVGDTESQGYRWHTGKQQAVPKFDAELANAYAVNNHGVVGGCSGYYPPEGGYWVNHAYLWTGSTLTDITPAGVGESCVYGLNNRSHAVGVAHAPDWSGAHAFLWKNGRFIDLNDKLPAGAAKHWHLINGVAINDRGEIVGDGVLDGVPMAYRLTPID